MIKYAILNFLLLFACGSSGDFADAQPSINSLVDENRNVPIYETMPKTGNKKQDAKIEQYLDRMTLDEKIGQLFWIDVFSNKGRAEIEETKRLIQDFHVGGIIWFRDTKKSTSPSQQLRYTNELQLSSKYPLIVSIDGEWGLNMRLDSTIQYPRQLELGAIQDNQLIQEFGLEVGNQLKYMGIHFNFAPVVDVNNNPYNPVINDRSFGEDKYNVAAKGIAYMKGMHQAGILCTAKHFPGHGDTNVDSHKDLPVINHNLTRLHDTELYPFQQMIQHRVGGIMVAHLSLPAIDPSPNRPATLSKKIVHDLLQTQLHFDGLIVTDAMNMQGVAKHYPSGIAEVEALKAGNDILLYSNDVPLAINAIKSALTHGELTEQRIDQSLRKILSAKRWLGILEEAQQIPASNITSYINRPQARLLNKKVREQSITLVKNEEYRLPYTDLSAYNFATVGIDDGSRTPFQDALSPYTKMDHFSISINASDSEYQKLFQQLSNYNQVLVGLVPGSRYKNKSFGISPSAINFLNQLEHQNKLVLSVFGNPYSLEKFSTYRHLILGYEGDPINQRATAEMIFGALPFKGKTPVAVTNIPFGTGTITPGNARLIYGQPEDFGLSSSQFYKIDSIAQDAINMGAAPGMVVLISKDNKVVYNRAYGYHTYNKRVPMQKDDIFDLASITKIAASLPAIMHEYDQGSITMKHTIGNLFPEYANSNKASMKIGEILNHTSGLKSWIPFYKNTVYGGRLSTIYRTTPANGYVQVANNIYILKNYEKDTILTKITESPNGTRGRYVYSDMGFYYFKNYFERKYQKPYDQYIDELFYRRVGFPSFTYNPLNKFPKNRIVPSERDTYFRNQTLQGYVHDMGAAMQGGVGGHAGLFGSANDLAIYMQLLLNEGSYGNVQYFSPSTVRYFTKQYNNNSRKGIGFDKPEKRPNKGDGPTCKEASADTFGHTGFTGTFAFADPQNQLSVIILSNRTYPSMENRKLITHGVRPKIQEEAYRIFKDIDLDE